jgi:hypothetical protein
MQNIINNWYYNNLNFYILFNPNLDSIADKIIFGD